MIFEGHGPLKPGFVLIARNGAGSLFGGKTRGAGVVLNGASAHGGRLPKSKHYVKHLRELVSIVGKIQGVKKRYGLLAKRVWAKIESDAAGGERLGKFGENPLVERAAVGTPWIVKLRYLHRRILGTEPGGRGRIQIKTVWDGDRTSEPAART